MTGENFTIMGEVTESDDDGIMFDTGDAFIEFAGDGTVVLGGDAIRFQDDLVIQTPIVYNYTDGLFTITGSTDDCEDYVFAFNPDGLLTGSEDCGFVAGAGAENGDEFLATDDFIAFGNEDAFIVFMEDSATFGSSMTGENFTVMGEVTELDDGGIMFDDIFEFAADGTVVITGDAIGLGEEVLVIQTPIEYNYTDGLFTITGSTVDCEDFVAAFNVDGFVAASEDCGFVFGVDEDGVVMATDDFLFAGDEDAFIVFMEDSATFGSSVTGENFTVVDLVIEATDDDEGIALTNEGGGTMTFYNDSVVLSSTAEGDEDILISDPAYNYVSGYFTITGAIENCDDFGFAFDADGLIAGSIDCGFLSGAGNLADPSIEFGEEDDDAEMQMDDDMEMQETDDDAIISASGDASGDDSMMSADGDDAVGSDSCETIGTLQ